MATSLLVVQIQCDGRRQFACDLISAGGNGYINDYPTGRFLRDAKLYEIGAGTSEVRRWLLGRAFNEMFKESN